MTEPSSTDRINAWLDRIPRMSFGRLGREAPAFRSMGIVGAYIALLVALAAALLNGRSLIMLGIAAAACALSFFGWAYLRRALTGRERLVAFEHLWAGLAATALALRALREPALPYLDVVAVALAFFLSVGRLGCLFVGCCHGQPASVGIVYGEAHGRDGFPRHLMGVRLLPVQALESMGLLLIGALGFGASPFAPPGRVLAWILGAHALVRFGLEGLRGDRRPHALGLSVGRWMAMAQLAFAVAITEPAIRSTPIAVALVSAAAIAGALVFRHVTGSAHRLSRPAAAARVRAIVRARAEAPPTRAEIEQTADGVRVGVSAAHGAEGVHVSLRLPDGARDLPLLCELATRALPELRIEQARIAGDGDLLFLHVPGLREPLPRALSTSADALYGSVVLRLQERLETSVPSAPEQPLPSIPEPVVSAPPSAPAPVAARRISPERLAYFGKSGGS